MADMSRDVLSPVSTLSGQCLIEVVGDWEKPGAERIAILGLVQVATAEPVSYAKSRPCFERGMARDAVASATRDAGDIQCEVGIAPVFSWSP
jgi:hypothetical protein